MSSHITGGLPFPPYPNANHCTLAYSVYRQVFNGADVDMSGRMTGEELAGYQNQLDSIRTLVADPKLDAQREAARNLMVNFDKIANRAHLPGEMYSMDSPPEDGTIELSEIQKLTRAGDTNSNDISQKDWQRFLGKGQSSPNPPQPAPPLPKPYPTTPAPRPQSKYDSFLQWLHTFVQQYNRR
ncbi:MAG: hypothetical protein QE263_09310 [Vampirovibrionales bacterium]|nr:hypothetical protein [Vampirovibrionales bacterium]